MTPHNPISCQILICKPGDEEYTSDGKKIWAGTDDFIWMTDLVSTDTTLRDIIDLSHAAHTM